MHKGEGKGQGESGENGLLATSSAADRRALLRRSRTQDRHVLTPHAGRRYGATQKLTRFGPVLILARRFERASAGQLV